ncbi:hypothetical protein [Stenotrophomonas oahuensis]|uniref:Uncharacterized protein n=1 Tax=Stenotrophomonas oahuensis TaxID=3003271 RepID=A0ABY9YKJ5_9GAMM|nr:hypothetical protein [Stenotrophomonas sp. A5586]WNH50828.1 hypothetical protein PDM29_10495 [Stenotrophomonas sp. A5586]
MLRAERSEIHLHAVVARAESVLSPSPDAGTHVGMGGGDGNWDMMAAFEPFKERIERLEVAMHPSIVEESETSLPSCIEIDGHEPDGMDGGGSPAEIAGSSVQAWGPDVGVASDWGDDFDGDFDSDFEDDIDADPAIQSDAGASDQRNIPETPEQRFRREGEEIIAAGLTWAHRAAQQGVAATDTSQTVVQEGGVQQLKLDVLRYRPELEAYDQLPLATRMASVESARRNSGVSDAEEQQASFLDALKKFDRDTLRTVGIAQAGEPERIASLVEQMFSRSFVHMQNENKSLINESDDDSGVDDAASVHDDADADWESDA